jgi:hypothetical protein
VEAMVARSDNSFCVCMPDTSEEPTEWATALFFIQQILVPLGSLGFGVLIGAWIYNLFAASSNGVKDVVDFLSSTLPGPLVGLSAGYNVQRFWPATYQTGRLVWVVPAICFALVLIIDLASAQPAARVLSGYFHPQRGEEALGLVLITCPTLSCCLYSAGMVWSRRQGGAHPR